jgi:hypothetical protein
MYNGLCQVQWGPAIDIDRIEAALLKVVSKIVTSTEAATVVCRLRSG